MGTYNKTYSLIIAFAAILVSIACGSAVAQGTANSDSIAAAPAPESMAKKLISSIAVGDIDVPTALKNLRFGGYYRFLGYHRMMTEQYPSQFIVPRWIGVGDNYREPMMLLTVLGNPANKVYFGSSFFIYTPYRGFDKKDIYNQNNLPTSSTLSLNIGVSLTGGIKTDAGNFNMEIGGISWYRLTPFTLWFNNQPYNRFSIFERNPWEPAGSAGTRYLTHYQEGSINQDTRWGRQGFQGIMVEGTDLPKKMAFSFMYGKTLNNGGSSSYLDRYKPNMVMAGRISKKIDGSSYVSLNTFNSQAYIDSTGINPNTKEYNIYTTESKLKIGYFTLNTEIGMGGYRSPTFNRAWSEAINAKLKTSKLLTYVPIELSFYQVGKNFVNINSASINTSLPAAIEQYKSNSISTIFPSSSPMMDIGYMANNRRAFGLSTEFKIGDLKVSLGNEMSTEIEKSDNKITFYHKVNALALSRIYNFTWMPAVYGPYNNLTSGFRSIFEQVDLTDGDVSGKALNSKHFNVLEMQAKYRLKVLNHDIFAHYIGSFNSVQKTTSAIPVFNDAAYLRVYYNEFEVFYNVTSSFSLVGYYGLERAFGNKDTKLSTDTIAGTNLPVNAPINQKTTGIGCGFDMDIGQNAGLYVRQRWYSHSDANFILDKYKGYETTIELKIFFD